MKTSVFTGFVAALLLTFSSGANSSVGGKPGAPEFLPADEIVAMFNAAVARGELVVFGRRVHPGTVRPVRVEYVVDLDSRSPTVKVYAELTPLLDPPRMPNCKAFAISAFISVDGRITETDVHIRPDSSGIPP
jgi:hypothetical protein